MAEELKPNPQEVDNIHEAQLAAEQMASGEEKMQTVDVDADYEASKKFSVSDVDKSGAGAASAAAATAPEQKLPEATDMASTPNTTGNPADYIEMAKEIKPKN
ncbi:MAG: hypothetical protein ABI417_08170 [Coleofasciculaceae cyanobacterium]